MNTYCEHNFIGVILETFWGTDLRRISEKGVVARGDTPPVGVRFFWWVGLYIIGC